MNQPDWMHPQSLMLAFDTFILGCLLGSQATMAFFKRVLRRKDEINERP